MESSMKHSNDFDKMRRRLWDRFITLQAKHAMNTSFDQIWYDYHIRHFITEGPLESIYDDFCSDLERYCITRSRTKATIKSLGNMHETTLLEFNNSTV